MVVEDLSESMYRMYNEVDPVREDMIRLSREIMIKVRRGFEHAYRNDIDRLKKVLSDATRDVERCLSILNSNPRYRDCLERVLKDCMREYSELVFFYTWLSRDSLYLNYLPNLKFQWVMEGLRDFAGEVYRFSLNMLIMGDCDNVFEAIRLLEDIANILSTRIVPNYIYNNYKRDVDSIRRAADNLKSEYIRVCGVRR